MIGIFFALTTDLLSEELGVHLVLPDDVLVVAGLPRLPLVLDVVPLLLPGAAPDPSHD